MQAEGGVEMSDSEVITLLGEFGFKDTEKNKLLKEITSRKFEVVLQQIEELQAKLANKGNVEREEYEKDFHKAQEETRAQEARDKAYRKQLIEKIKANRKERTIKNQGCEDRAETTPQKTASIQADVKVKAVIAGSGVLVLGFDKSSKVSELYSKVREHTNSSNIRICQYGDVDPVAESEEPIADAFGAHIVLVHVTVI